MIIQNKHYNNLSYQDLTKLALGNNISMLDLEIICCHVLKIPRSYLKAYPENNIPPAKIEILQQYLTRRMAKEPVAYLTHHKEFWDLALTVNKDVLIPRPETELLVEQTLNLLPKNSSAKILELGTGSGAIALAIAKHRPLVQIVATDISIHAIRIAKLNAKNLKLEHNIKFICSDWFKAIDAQQSKFNIIISNPPYIGKHEKHLCDPEIFFEPQLALFADAAGFACLEQIIQTSKKHLLPKGVLLLEHGKDQIERIIINLQVANFNNITSILDLNSIARAVYADL